MGKHKIHKQLLLNKIEKYINESLVTFTKSILVVAFSFWFCAHTTPKPGTP